MQTSDGLHAPDGSEIELRLDGATAGWERLLREGEHVVALFPHALLDDDAIVGAYLWSRRG
jgi:hypothetical protein